MSMKYIARVYPLTDNQEEIAAMAQMRFVTPEGEPYTTEMPPMSDELKRELQWAYGKKGCYIDQVAVLEESDGNVIDTPHAVFVRGQKEAVFNPSSPSGHGWVVDSETVRMYESPHRIRPRNTRVQRTYAKRKAQGLVR
jgi:hypothetical protein